MFDDLFHLVSQLEHDYRDENGNQAHALGCRRCAITTSLNTFKMQITRLLRDFDFAIGEEPIDKNIMIGKAGCDTKTARCVAPGRTILNGLRIRGCQGQSRLTYTV